MTKSFHAQHHVGRLDVTLNIGLVGNPYSGLSQRNRAKAYADDIARLLASSDTGHLQGIDALPVADTVLLLQSFYPSSRKDNDPANPSGAVVQWSAHVTENTDVITFDLQQCGSATQDAETILRRLVYRLAILLHQEAIAVTWFDPGARDASGLRGAGLYGPASEEWGPFDADCFQAFLKAADNVPVRFPEVTAPETPQTALEAILTA